MHAVMDMAPGAFFELDRGFVMPTRDIKFRTEIVLGNKLPVSCMFDIYLLHHAGERVGFYFTTRFEVTNGGAYLLTCLHNKQKATEVNTLIKTDELVVYNYPNRGTLAISPLVSDEVSTIFEEQ